MLLWAEGRGGGSMERERKHEAGPGKAGYSVGRGKPGRARGRRRRSLPS